MKKDQIVQSNKKVNKMLLKKFFIEWFGISFFLFTAGMFHDLTGWHKGDPCPPPPMNFKDALLNNFNKTPSLLVIVGIGVFYHIYIYKSKRN